MQVVYKKRVRGLDRGIQISKNKQKHEAASAECFYLSFLRLLLKLPINYRLNRNTIDSYVLFIGCIILDIIISYHSSVVSWFLWRIQSVC